jgi:hypothetical protein
VAHTGNYSLAAGNTYYAVDTFYVNNPDGRISLDTGKNYLFSGWAYLYDITGMAVIDLFDNHGYLSSTVVDSTVNPIDGWRKFDLPIETEDQEYFYVRFSASATDLTDVSYAYFDDIRLKPLNCIATTYVYDYNNHRLIATFDNDHFATHVHYDIAGNPVLVNRETERGMVTVQSTIRNIGKGD